MINNGPADTTGTTTVRDILPAGIEYTGAVNGNGFWSCAISDRVLTCTTTSTISHIALFAPVIEVPFRVTATSGTIKNIASVDNPNETNRCNADGSLPSTDTASCTKDPTNSDPAFITVTPSTLGPVCSSSISGTLTAPLMGGAVLCDVGTATGLTAMRNSSNQTTDYRWSCEVPSKSPTNCSANYTPPVATPDLRIKKYVKDISIGDTQTAPLAITLGEKFSYYYVLENSGSAAATNVMIKDTLPQYLTFS